jgi:hypothetical protein
MYNGYKGNKYVRSGGGGGVSSLEQRSRARSWRGRVSENWIAGSAAASLFFLTAIAIAIATRPFKFHENSVAYTSRSFVSSIHSLAPIPMAKFSPWYTDRGQQGEEMVVLADRGGGSGANPNDSEKA